MSTETQLLELFSENVVAKVLRVATEALTNNVRYTNPFLVSSNVSEPTNRLPRIRPPA